ncbi:MAG TPA: lysophospholipid acyltransferase family protein [Azoarcus taiwanensis]|nr:lysophospholipid acyltransferase family protein [Azoarcus taiwanensis]
MNWIRSSLFALVVLIVTPPYVVFGWLTFFLPPDTRHRIISSWAHVVLWFVWHLLAIRYRVLGEENIPSRPVVVLSKHQSAWETMALQQIFPKLSFVLKKELLKVPFLGWGLAQLEMIAIDRSAGKDALEQVVDQGRDRLQDGYSIVVFPEGTRVPVGQARRYKLGGAWLATQTATPVIPVAHNAGEFWRRNAFLKKPGEITVSVGPVIETEGRTPQEVNQLAETWIEGEMHRLFPHHFEGE